MEGAPTPFMPHFINSGRNRHSVEGGDQFRCKGMIRSGILARDKLAVFHHMRGEVDGVRYDFATRHTQRVGHREIKLAMENLLFDWFLFAG